MIQREDLPGTLPYSVMPVWEAAWLAEAAPQVTFTEMRGYRFANGDLVLMFSCDPPVEHSSFAPRQALAATAKDRYTRAEEEVWLFIDGGFGYLAISKQYRSELGTFAQWARWGHQQLIDGE